MSVSATHYAVRWEAGVWTEPETTVMARLKGSRVLIRMSERVFFNKNTRKGFYLFEQQCLNMRSFRIIGKFLIPTGTQALLEWDSDTDSNWDNKKNGKDEKEKRGIGQKESKVNKISGYALEKATTVGLSPETQGECVCITSENSAPDIQKSSHDFVCG